MFDGDQTPFHNLKGTPDPALTGEHKAVARQVSRESFVLLKNAHAFLPLDKNRLRSVVVIGPLANVVPADMYSGAPPYVSTPLAALKARLEPEVRVAYFDANSLPDALRAARSADLAIAVVGNDPTCNNTPQQVLSTLMGKKSCADPAEGMEGSDRKSIELPQEALVKEVYAANPKTAVILVASSPYAINWTQQKVPAILHTSHSGQEEGNALVDILFGDYNPSGRLVQTWPTSLEQVPPMMDYDLRHGRTYLYSERQPLYAFGYGLSYSKFAYSKISLSRNQVKTGETLLVKVDVTNRGKMTGDEVVQLYVKHVGSTVDRPLKELKAFRRVTIGAGQTAALEIPLKVDSLAWWNPRQHRYELEADRVRIMLGGASDALVEGAEVQVTAGLPVGAK